MKNAEWGVKRKIVLVASLAAGALAAVLTRFYIAVKEGEVAEREAALVRRYGAEEFLCFRKDVPPGTVLSKSDLGLRTMPSVGMRGQALTEARLHDVIGRKTLSYRQEGDVVFWSDIEGGDPQAQSLSRDVRRQMRAMSIVVTEASSVSGMVRPGDRVDVIGTFGFPSEDGVARRDDLVTCTLLQDVLVLATGRETAQSSAREFGLGARRSGYSTVTLEVTPREAEVLAFAEQMKSRLVLTLRNRNDLSTERELPCVDFGKIRGEIEQLNAKRQQMRAGGR